MEREITITGRKLSLGQIKIISCQLNIFKQRETLVTSFSCFLAESPASWPDSSSSLTKWCYGPVNFCYHFLTAGVIILHRVWVPALAMVSSSAEVLLPLLWCSWKRLSSLSAKERRGLTGVGKAFLCQMLSNAVPIQWDYMCVLP